MAKCAFGIITKTDGRILLVQIAPYFKEDHKWNLSSGVIDAGEELEICFVREVLEGMRSIGWDYGRIFEL